MSRFANLEHFITRNEAEYRRWHSCPGCYYKKYHYRVTSRDYRCSCGCIFKYDEGLNMFVIEKL